MICMYLGEETYHDLSVTCYLVFVYLVLDIFMSLYLIEILLNYLTNLLDLIIIILLLYVEVVLRKKT